MTSLLLLMFVHRHQQRWGIGDEKSLKKQERRLDQHYLKTGRGYPWHTFFYRSVSKISRQVIRFLKECFLKKSSAVPYEDHLRPLLEKYL